MYVNQAGIDALTEWLSDVLKDGYNARNWALALALTVTEDNMTMEVAARHSRYGQPMTYTLSDEHVF